MSLVWLVPVSGLCSLALAAYHTKLTQDLPYLDASASLFLDCQTFVELFSGENAHFYQNSAERPTP